jgi:tetratricopeptide (TPR) repeat protein
VIQVTLIKGGTDMKRTALFSSLLSAMVLLITVPSSSFATELAIASPTDIQAHLQRGDEFFSQGDLSAARKEYEAAAKLMREENQIPAKAMHRIAYTQYYEGKYQTAGKTLEKLAKEAAAFGDLKTEAWALADAAWVAWKAGDTLDVKRRLVRLERLLTSPYLPADVKQEIRAKRLGEYSLALDK